MTAPALTGTQQGELQRLLSETFDPEELKRLLLHYMNVRLHDVAGTAGTFQSVLLQVIGYAVRHDLWQELLFAARNERPDSAGLLIFAGRFGLAPRVTIANGVERVALAALADGARQLQLKIRTSGSTFGLREWLRRLSAIEGQVCRIEFPRGEARGTGVLIGPATVVTNYHVIEQVICEQIGHGHVVLRFDCHAPSADGTVADGTVYSLAADWMVDASPYSRLDLVGGHRASPGPDELDYAILRLDGAPGDEPVGTATGDEPAPPRGWIEAPGEEHDFDSSPALHIVQHPAGRTLEVALDTDAVMGCNVNRTRVRYRTTTEPGSSGSPCFDANWRWVALHQSGDPMYWQGRPATYNQGVPLAAIRRLAAARGADRAFGR
jgi:hypothetical protein